jgi:hypothetical protein
MLACNVGCLRTFWRVHSRDLVWGSSVRGRVERAVSYPVTVVRVDGFGLSLYSAFVNYDTHAALSSDPEGVVPHQARQVVFPWGATRPMPNLSHLLDGEAGEVAYSAGAWTAGWPCRCVWCVWEAPELTELGAGVKRVLIPRRPSTEALVIPYWFLWPGLAADSAFYATVVASLYFGPTAVRGVLRRRRGRCPRCGYDLKHNLAAGCPECGWGRDAPNPATPTPAP